MDREGERQRQAALVVTQIQGFDEALIAQVVQG
jgi:hypothetical protein